jgi:hypothetical protein
VNSLASGGQLPLGDRLRCYCLTPPELTLSSPPLVPIIVDAAGEFRQLYGVTSGAAYLIRPDRHVGYRTDRLERERLLAHLRPLFRLSS